MKFKKIFNCPAEIATQKFAEQVASLSQTPMLIYCHGELGAGKTTWVRAFLNALGVNSHVKSPTYTLVETYELSLGSVFHFDFYRLHDPMELEELGFRDYLQSNAICCIEWPERAADILPTPDLEFYFDVIELGREITCIAQSPLGKKILENISQDKIA